MHEGGRQDFCSCLAITAGLPLLLLFLTSCFKSFSLFVLSGTESMDAPESQTKRHFHKIQIARPQPPVPGECLESSLSDTP